MQSRLFVLVFFLLPAFSSGKGGRGGGGRGSSAGRSSSRGSSGGSSGSRGRSGGGGHSWSTGGAAGGGFQRRLDGFSYSGAPIRQHSSPSRPEIESLKVALLASLQDPPRLVRESAVPSAVHKRPYYFISPKSAASYSFGYVQYSHSGSGDRCSIPMDDLIGSPRRLNNAFENLLRINYLDCFNNRSANGGDIEWYTRCFEEAKNPTTTTVEPRSAEDRWLLDMRLSDGSRPTEMVWRCPFREYCCGVDCCKEEPVYKTSDKVIQKIDTLVVILALFMVVCFCYVFACCDKLKQKECAGLTGTDETETITTQPAASEQSGSEGCDVGSPSAQLMDGDPESEKKWTPNGNPPFVVFIHTCDAKAPPPYDSNC